MKIVGVSLDHKSMQLLEEIQTSNRRYGSKSEIVRIAVREYLQMKTTMFREIIALQKDPQEDPK